MLKPLAAGGYHAGQRGDSTRPPLQEVLLHSTEADWESSMGAEDNQLNKMHVQTMGQEERDQWGTELLGTVSEFVPVPSHTYSISPTAIALPSQASVTLLPSLIFICCFIKQMSYMFKFVGIAPLF